MVYDIAQSVVEDIYDIVHNQDLSNDEIAQQVTDVIIHAYGDEKP